MEVASSIIGLSLLKKLEAKAKRKTHWTSDNKEDLSIQYQSTVFSEEGNDIEEQFLSMLEKTVRRIFLGKQQVLGLTGMIWHFLSIIMNATFGSQGQHRSVFSL